MTAKKVYDNQRRPVSLDARHVIYREWTGKATPQWVFRWCNEEFISSHCTKREAIDAALQWEKARIDRMESARWITLTSATG